MKLKLAPPDATGTGRGLRELDQRKVIGRRNLNPSEMNLRASFCSSVYFNAVDVPTIQRRSPSSLHRAGDMEIGWIERGKMVWNTVSDRLLVRILPCVEELHETTLLEPTHVADVNNAGSRIVVGKP